MPEEDIKPIQNRRNETDTIVPERKKRIFRKADGYFYYRTREGMNVGPFDTEDLALTSINDYIENFIKKTEDNVIKKISASYSQ